VKAQSFQHSELVIKGELYRALMDSVVGSFRKDKFFQRSEIPQHTAIHLKKWDTKKDFVVHLQHSQFIELTWFERKMHSPPLAVPDISVVATV
jgi:hypothetical protein